MVAGVTEGYTKNLEIVRHGVPRAGQGHGPRVRPGLQPPGPGPGPRGHHVRRWRPRPGSRSPGSTSSRSARSPRTCASCASPTRTRARACGMRAKSFAARPERQVGKPWLWQPRSAQGTARGWGARAAICGCARRSPAPPARPRLVVNRSTRHIFVQVVDDAVGRTLASASTMESDLRSHDGRQDRQGAPGRRAGCRAARRPRASTRSCSTVAATSITVASPPWPTAPATRAWRSDEKRSSTCLEFSAAPAGPVRVAVPTSAAVAVTTARPARRRSAFVERVVAINRVAKVVQGRSPVQLHRAGGRRRRRRQGRRRLRQGQGGARGDRQGCRGGQEEHFFTVPAAQGDDPAPGDRARPRPVS